MRRLRRGLQYGLALLLSATGTGKLLDVGGFVQVLTTYQTLPDWLQWPVAITLIGVELLLTAWLFSGWRLSHAALASVVLHSMFTGWSIATLWRGIKVPNCGCFGVFWGRPLTWGTVGEDLVLVGISWTLYALARSARSPYQA
jgi:hypothetical protein